MSSTVDNNQTPVRRCFEVEVFVKSEEGNPIAQDFGMDPAVLLKQEVCFELPPERFEGERFAISLAEFAQDLLKSTVEYRIKEVAESDRTKDSQGEAL